MAGFPPQGHPREDSSIAGRIARVLGDRIVQGGLLPGTPIRQDHVASEFRTSHVPVREAFRRLEAQGLVIFVPRHGVRVAPLDPATVMEVTEMRAVLEVLALRHAFARVSAEDLATAEAALAEGETSDDIALWEAANRRFHRALIRAAPMPRLLAAVDDLHRVAARFLFATWKELSWEPRSAREHRALLEAVRAGDAAAACTVLNTHILDAGRALSDRLQGDGAAQ